MQNEALATRVLAKQAKNHAPYYGTRNKPRPASGLLLGLLLSSIFWLLLLVFGSGSYEANRRLNSTTVPLFCK
jgi:hypothetical protein